MFLFILVTGLTQGKPSLLRYISVTRGLPEASQRNALAKQLLTPVESIRRNHADLTCETEIGRFAHRHMEKWQSTDCKKKHKNGSQLKKCPMPMLARFAEAQKFEAVKML
jgi:hypothetical protein